MITGRLLLKQLSHALDKLSQASEAVENEEYDTVKVNIRASYNLIHKALGDEKLRKRNGDKKFNMSRRKILKKHIKTFKEDLIILRIDIKHDNKASAYNGIDTMRNTISKIEGIEKESFRRGDSGR